MTSNLNFNIFLIYSLQDLLTDWMWSLKKTGKVFFLLFCLSDWLNDSAIIESWGWRNWGLLWGEVESIVSFWQLILRSILDFHRVVWVDSLEFRAEQNNNSHNSLWQTMSKNSLLLESGKLINTY